MDPMSQAEEERRLKEEAEYKELYETVFLNECYFSSRDLSKKGRDVHPTGKQGKDVQILAKTIKFVNPPQSRSFISSDQQHDGVDDNIGDFSLTAKPRIFITSGSISKREPDKILRKISRKFLFLFNDLLLITTKKDSAEQYEAQQILYVKDLRIKHLHDDVEENKLSFELIINKTRSRPKSSVFFTCDSEESKNEWTKELENVLLAYHRDTPFSKQLGWFHEIIQGTLFSSAYLGDHTSMRKHLKYMSYRGIGIDILDASGMSALHWAVLKGHEICTRLLLDRGADVDVLQGGVNTPLLLAAACGYENIARLLIERGADIYARNQKDHDAVFMAVVYGHASKGLPWTLQLLNAKGLDLNQADSVGATPLHLCAQKNLARPVRMLVDSGAEVNAKHGKTQLTPLQMACSHAHPDVETIRSFLDKGAYPNWKDLQGRTAFNLAMNSQHLHPISNKATTDIFSGSPMFAQPGSNLDLNQLLLSPSGGGSGSGGNRGGSGSISSAPGVSVDGTGDNRLRTDSTPSQSAPSTPAPSGGGRSSSKWRPMEGTLEKVGDWAVKALPALLEITKKGGRFEEKDLECLRPSFRAAVMEARTVWEQKNQPQNFAEFVLVREQSGEDLRLHKESWLKDSSSNICNLCSDQFSTLTNRKHHCRACGVLCCDICSSKRLQLTAIDYVEQDYASANSTPVSNRSSMNLSSANLTSGGGGGGASGGSKKDDRQERVCDGCFNRLSHEAVQPSPDHFRVKQLKQCALDVMQSIEDLIDSLDDPEGDPNSFQSSLRETQALTRGLEAVVSGKASFASTRSGGGGGGATPSKQFSSRSIAAMQITPPGGNAVSPMPYNGVKTGEALIDVLKIRDARVSKTEDFIAKFLEAADGYHKITKKLIEQKTATNRLWGAPG